MTELKQEGRAERTAGDLIAQGPFIDLDPDFGKHAL
jgi:hypothetical protein